jgi:hypothetical protein
MKNGTIDWCWSHENELNNGLISTIELFGECDYNFTPGCREVGPRYSHGGLPAEPPEVEYYNFQGLKIEVALWSQKAGEDKKFLFNQTCEYFSPGQKKEVGDWFESILNDDLRNSLDEKVISQRDQRE